MRKKKMMMVAALGISLFSMGHVVYGYWTDRIQVREELALVWPVEVELEEESEAMESEAAESSKAEHESAAGAGETMWTEKEEGSRDSLPQEPEA